MLDSVLLIDDERNIRVTLSQALKDMGLDVTTAVTGEEALNLLRERRYGFILLDLRLPGMDGMEVLRRMHTLLPEIPVILFTAHGSIETAVEAMKIGAVDYIQKPFTPKELREVVRRVRDRYRAAAAPARRNDP